MSGTPVTNGKKIWNRNINYEETMVALRSAVRARGESNRRMNTPTKRSKSAVLLIALRNGARISESVDAYNLFCETKVREVRVRVRKRGWDYPIAKEDYHGAEPQKQELLKPVDRLMVIPEEVSEDLPAIKCTLSNLTHFAKRHFSWNPHSTRYAWITHASKTGVTAQLIVAVTGHACIQSILDYVQKISGEDLLRRLD